jgi:hypothetical protein
MMTGMRPPGALKCQAAAQSACRRVIDMVFAEWQVGQMVWTMLWFTLFFIWIWMLFAVFADIFRSPDLSGWGKALWSIFVIVAPYLGVFVYLIARGKKMGEHAMQQAQEREAATRAYIQNVAETSSSPADQIARAAELKAQGAITDAEFEALKAKALA